MTPYTSPITLDPVPGGQCAIRVVAEGFGVSWLLRIPEGLSCDEGMFKTHEWPLIDWLGPDSHGAVSSAWESGDADFERIRRYERAEEFALHFVQGIRYEIEIRPVEDGADLRITAENITRDRTWHNVLANPCLGTPDSAAFEDPGFNRTYLATVGGLTPLSVADRGTGDPIRTHFDVAGRPGKAWFAEPFWGLPSETVSSDGSILREDADGRSCVGFGWAPSGGVFHNEDAHHCVHSVAALGDLSPGESNTVRGRIVLVEGDARFGYRRLTEALAGSD